MSAPVRGFSVLSEAWYAEHSKMRGIVDEIEIGLYPASGSGCCFEFAIRWHLLNRETAARVEVFDDAFRAFAEFFDVFASLAKMRNPSVAAVAAMLRTLGYVDRTQRTRGGRS